MNNFVYIGTMVLCFICGVTSDNVWEAAFRGLLVGIISILVTIVFEL